MAKIEKQCENCGKKDTFHSLPEGLCESCWTSKQEVESSGGNFYE